MKRTEKEFVARWRGQAITLGMDMLAVLTGPAELKQRKAEAILRLPEEIDRLLSRMYQDLAPEPNGQPKPQPRSTT